MKIILIIGIIIFIGIGGYFLLRSDFSQAPYSPSTQTEMEDSNISNKDNESGDEQATIKEFNMRAFKWSFDPAIITVDKGDRVKLHIISEDVTHGFNLQAFGINENLAPGKTTNVEFIANKTGTFTFVCSVFCGAGHSDMAGQLIVK